MGDLEVYLLVLGRLLRAMTKKIVNFLRKKSAPPDKILVTPMLCSYIFPRSLCSFINKARKFERQDGGRVIKITFLMIQRQTSFVY